MSTPEETIAETSSDARNSTYEEATDVPETNPPSGPSVIQTRGLPAEATETKTSTKSSTSPSTSTS